MSSPEASARETPPDDDDDDAKPNKVETDDDDLQLLFATNPHPRNKRTKAFMEDEEEGQKDDFKLKKKLIVDLNSPIHLDDDDDDDDDDDEVQLIYSFPGKLTSSKYNIGENSGLSTHHLSMLVMCEICADEKPRINFVTVMGCDHLYCSECVASYVASKLQQNVVEITCPVSGCAGVLGPEHCRSVLPKQVYERWGTALCEEIICPSQKFYCPYKECSALMIDETGETGEVITQMECPNCQRLFCIQCKTPWHKGVDCHDFQMLNEDERGQQDIMLVNLAKKNMWKRCPSCKMYVQRSHGCNVMKCRCGCSFCYACGGAFPRCHCMEGYAQRFPVGGHYAINQARQIPPLVDVPANQTQNNPLLHFHQQGPMEVHTNASLGASSTAQWQSRGQLLQILSANQSQPDPSILSPQGPVGGRLNTPNARLDLVGGRSNTPRTMHLEQMQSHMQLHQLQMMNRLQTISRNQNRSNINIQPLEASVSRTNESNQESQSLPRTLNVTLVENLSASRTRSYTNIPPLLDSVVHTNGLIQRNQVFPVTSHVDPVENLSASETQLSGTSIASNQVWPRRQG